MPVSVPEFRCEVREGKAGAVLSVFGELDLATVPEAEGRLRELAATKRRVTLDLRGVEFVDSTGLRMMIELGAVARRDGYDFRIAEGPPAVRRTMDIAGVREHLHVVENPEHLDS